MKPDQQNAATSRVTVGQFCARSGTELALSSDPLDDAPLMSGNFLQYQLAGGLWLHGGDVIEEQAFDITSSIDEGLACIFFLDGHVETHIGDRALSFQATKGGPVRAATLMNARQESFRRKSPARQRVRHLVVNASADWLAQHGYDAISDSGMAHRLFNENLTAHHWIVPRSLQSLISNLLDTQRGDGPLERMYAESRAIQIVAESITNATAAERAGASASRSATLALSRARELIQNNMTDDMTVASIARQAGVSVSGLQALFRRHEGCGVYEYVRNVRLDRAREGLTSGALGIDEASAVAGYAHSANFATAFRRRFSVSPGQLLRGSTGPRGVN